MHRSPRRPRARTRLRTRNELTEPPTKPLGRSGLHKILTNPYYLGDVVFRSVRYEGRHPAIVDPSTWQRVQDVLAAHNSAGDRQQQHDHYLKGSIFCGSCGHRLLVMHSKNRHGVIYPYFICSGRHRKATTCTRQAMLIDWVERRTEEEYARVSLLLAVALFAHGPAALRVHVSAWLGEAGWPGSQAGEDGPRWCARWPGRAMV
ncbi:MAG TPA: recombinase zinc beta ribbon domain-containing protein [Streptosporangiaceae bacterium]|nr:recombinase zinc beta ribbon domain-containing protein [Streptosporangiaceae bacterium]